MTEHLTFGWERGGGLIGGLQHRRTTADHAGGRVGLPAMRARPLGRRGRSRSMGMRLWAARRAAGCARVGGRVRRGAGTRRTSASSTFRRPPSCRRCCRRQRAPHSSSPCAPPAMPGPHERPRDSCPGGVLRRGRCLIRRSGGRTHGRRSTGVFRRIGRELTAYGAGAPSRVATVVSTSAPTHAAAARHTRRDRLAISRWPHRTSTACSPSRRFAGDAPVDHAGRRRRRAVLAGGPVRSRPRDRLGRGARHSDATPGLAGPIVVTFIVVQVGRRARLSRPPHARVRRPDVPESSTWSAGGRPRTRHGRRISVQSPWSGYELVGSRPGARSHLALDQHPRRLRPRPSTGVPRPGARLGRGEHAIGDLETSYLRGDDHVNGRPAETTILRSPRRDVP